MFLVLGVVFFVMVWWLLRLLILVGVCSVVVVLVVVLFSMGFMVVWCYMFIGVGIVLLLFEFFNVY